jgi:predicted O-methyltransferase YrrM
MPSRIGQLLGYYAGKLRNDYPDLVRDPAGAWLRFRDRRDARFEFSRPRCSYRSVATWERELHDRIGVPWPCAEAAEFRGLWPKIAALVVAKGYRFGPESYLGWNDGDPEFVRALWCLVRHLRPSVIVETGVGHGISTRFTLEALERNGHGRLYSIDQMHVDPALAAQVGIAVDGFAPQRWQLLTGTSRRLLRRLLAGLGRVDLFVHDSLHTQRNVCFEIKEAKKVLPAGAFAVVDDIDTNWGLQALMTEFPGDRFWVCEAEPVQPDLRRFNKRGLFAVIQNAPAQ